MSHSERDRLARAFAADPELAKGLSTMLADLPPDMRDRLMRRLAVRLERAPLGSGAVVPALADVIEETLERTERNSG